MKGLTFPLGHSRFLSNPFHFNIHHSLSHLSLYIGYSDSVIKYTTAHPKTSNIENVGKGIPPKCVATLVQMKGQQMSHTLRYGTFYGSGNFRHVTLVGVNGESREGNRVMKGLNGRIPRRI
jgi:hypothetical protein